MYDATGCKKVAGNFINGSESVRITKRKNIAVRVLMNCAANDQCLVTKAEIAKCCNVSESHLAQVINQLSQLKYVRTQRGRNGGMMLARRADTIRIGDVFRDFEGEQEVAGCIADADDSCPLVPSCWLRLALRDAVSAFYAHLDEITLDSLVYGNADLLQILQPVAKNCNHS